MKIFATFSFLWAFSALLDLVTSSLLTRSLVHGLLAASCLAVMLRPRSIGFFVAMNALRLAAFVDETPVTPNHQVLFSVCSLAILGAFVAATWRARGPRAVGAEAWLASFAPMLRASVVALYFFAVFHKLNVDYLDPSVSCAVDLFLLVSPGWLADAIRAFPAMHPALVYGSLAIEAAIPILLLVPRTRPMGLPDRNARLAMDRSRASTADQSPVLNAWVSSSSIVGCAVHPTSRSMTNIVAIFMT